MGGVDGALRLAAVYACVRFLAEGVAKLPLQQFRDLGDRTMKMPAGQLLSKPSRVCEQVQLAVPVRHVVRRCRGTRRG